MFLNSKIIHLKNGMTFELRSPRTEEAQECLHMMIEVSEKSPYILSTPDNFKQRSLESQIKWFEDCAASNSAIQIAAFFENQMIGFCNAQSYKEVKRRHRAALGITLHPRFRGLGLGTKMMEVLIENMKKFEGLKIIELDVMTNNSAAVKTYEKLGFKKVGHYPNAFILTNGEVSDNLTMILEV